MGHFTEVFNETLALEGKYSNNSNDSGGETMYGVTARVARKCGYLGEMKDLPSDIAEKIAKNEYWDPIKGDEIALISLLIAKELFDTGYNMGIGTAGTFLQRCLNAFNKQGKVFKDLVVDSNIGSGTVVTLAEFIKLRGKEGEIVLLRGLNCLQGARYIGIAEADVRQEEFCYGWLLNRVKI